MEKRFIESTTGRRNLARVFLLSLAGSSLILAGTGINAWAGGFAEQLARVKQEQRIEASDRLFSLFASDQWFSNPSHAFMMDSAQQPPKEGVFEQRLNPFDPQDTRTFKQRFYVSDIFADGPDSPVFYYICGEATCTADSLHGAIAHYAELHHGYLVALEHRFYGESQPFSALTPENLKYLRMDYALEDLANFEAYAQKQWGLAGKWISVGGSYPGALSAFYRLKHPEMVAGALASSAPVQPKENFELYDYVVHDRVGPKCAAAMQSAVAEIEKRLDDPQTAPALKDEFQASQVKDPVDFLYIVADMGATAVQYGMKDQFCNTLLSSSDLVSGYAQAGVAAFSALGITPFQDTFEAITSTDPQDYISGFGGRQWFYQSCTEFGYFQNAYHDPADSVRSARINLAFHHRICNELFGVPPLDTSTVENEFYKPLLDSSTSRILFTNGSNDPWATLSISHALGNDTNPNLTTYTIQGAAHCDDLRSPRDGDSDSLQHARSIFTGLLDQWLQ